MLIYEEPVRVDFVNGDATGLAIPAHGEALREAGAAFLTAACRAFGSLPADNHVAGITAFERCTAGSTGEKFFVSVAYARAEPGLPCEFFVKFSRDFNDAFRDRRRGELEAEINLAALSQLPGFPIAVPLALFADFHRRSGTGIIINERIPFGSGGIEPVHEKCMDYRLSNPPEYYRAILTALAKLAGAHKSGALSPQLETLFPFDAQKAATDDPILYTEEQTVEMVQRYARFAESYPQLLPANVRTPEFIARFERGALNFLKHQTLVRRYLHRDPDYIAFSHFNTHIDNAWFWRDAQGRLQCGLMDWQRARQMNLGYALWGGLSGGSLKLFNDELDGLLGFFIEALHAYGGAKLDLAELKLHIDLYAATMVLAGMFNTPAIVLQRLPEAAEAAGPEDAVFAKSEAARSFLRVFTNFLNLWERHDFGKGLELVLARMGAS
jgi:hypothetical protein